MVGLPQSQVTGILCFCGKGTDIRGAQNYYAWSADTARSCKATSMTPILFDFVIGEQRNGTRLSGARDGKRIFPVASESLLSTAHALFHSSYFICAS